MTPLLHSIEGRCPRGADALREQLRWMNAERAAGIQLSTAHRRTSVPPPLRHRAMPACRRVPR